MCAMRVTVTGATGLIGASLVAALRERGAQVTVLTRDPVRAGARRSAMSRRRAGSCWRAGARAGAGRT